MADRERPAARWPAEYEKAGRVWARKFATAAALITSVASVWITGSLAPADAAASGAKLGAAPAATGSALRPCTSGTWRPGPLVLPADGQGPARNRLSVHGVGDV